MKKRRIQKRAEKTAPLPKKSVLILEDNTDCSQTYAALVQSMNFMPIIANDGHLALNHIKDLRKLDLILLDIDLPRMNGIRFYNELQKSRRHKNAKVILTSSHPLSADIAIALKLFGHVSKDKPLETLKSIVSKALT